MHSINSWKTCSRILSEDLVKLMKPGSIIYDLAAEQEEILHFQRLVKLILLME